MIPISSSIEMKRYAFPEVKRLLEDYQFTLGGNWEYANGSFDRSIDGDEQKVWLRLPFEVVHGHLDSEWSDGEAVIQFGQPYILKHLYNEGLSRAAQPRLLGAMLDQLQTPIDPDAQIEPAWTNQAKQIVFRVEQLLDH